MALSKLFVKEGYVQILGRSQKRALELLAAAKEAGHEGDVSTTSHGYIVPQEVADAVEGTKAEAAQEERSTEEQEQEQEKSSEQFNPDDHTVAEVQEYLEAADEEERARVLSAEAAGKNRSTLIDTKGDK